MALGVDITGTTETTFNYELFRIAVFYSFVGASRADTTVSVILTMNTAVVSEDVDTNFQSLCKLARDSWPHSPASMGFMYKFYM